MNGGAIPKQISISYLILFGLVFCYGMVVHDLVLMLLGILGGVSLLLASISRGRGQPSESQDLKNNRSSPRATT